MRDSEILAWLLENPIKHPWWRFARGNLNLYVQENREILTMYIQRLQKREVKYERTNNTNKQGSWNQPKHRNLPNVRERNGEHYSPW